MSRVLLASDIQPDDDAARALAEKRERAIAEAVAAALLALSTFLAGAAVMRMIARFDTRGLIQTVQSADADRDLIQAYQPIADLFNEAARQAANDNLPGVVYDPLRAATGLATIRAGFTGAIQRAEPGVLRAVLLDALHSRNNDPAVVQRTMQQVIGLTEQQAKAVLNFRRMLTVGDRNVLTRALRDPRYDAQVHRALAGDVALRPEQIDAMVGRYAERMLSHRAATIGQTEAMQAAVSGIRNAYVQAVETKQLFDHEVRRFWLTAGDELTCPVCASVPLLNRGGVGVNDLYVSISGLVLAPLLHPRCRCSERYQANLTRLTGQPFAMAA